MITRTLNFIALKRVPLNPKPTTSHLPTPPPIPSPPPHSLHKATMIYFLEDIEEGGETIFPLVAKGTSARYGRADLTTDDGLELGKERFEEICADPANSPFLTVKPKKGAAILFYTLRPDGAHDKFSLHGGCPPRKGGGDKWISQQWIRENKYEMKTVHWNFAAFELEKMDTVGGFDIVEDYTNGHILRRESDGTIKPGQKLRTYHEFKICSAPSENAWPGRNLRDSGASTFG